MKHYYIFIFFIFYSCKSKQDKILDKLYGQWSIEEIHYDGVNYKEDLYINFMVFEKENRISIPESVHFEKDTISKWYLNIEDKNKYKILIESKDLVFKGVYNVKFIKNESEKLLGIEMTSDSTYIKAYKFFQNFNIDGEYW